MAGPSPQGSPSRRLLGQRLPSPLAETQYLSTVSSSDPDFMEGHRIHDTVLFPGAGFVDMGLSAASELLTGEIPTLEGLVLRKALVLDTPEPRFLQTVLDPGGGWVSGLQDLQPPRRCRAG